MDNLLSACTDISWEKSSIAEMIRGGPILFSSSYFLRSCWQVSVSGLHGIQSSDWFLGRQPALQWCVPC
jgi:hypothetical protein